MSRWTCFTTAALACSYTAAVGSGWFWPALAVMVAAGLWPVRPRCSCYEASLGGVCEDCWR